MQAASLNNNDPNACNNNVVEVSLFHNQITSFILLIINLAWNKLKINNKMQKKLIILLTELKHLKHLS